MIGFRFKFGATNYLNVGKVYLVLLEEADEFLEVVFSWEIVTTVWPYSLKTGRTSLAKKYINNNIVVQEKYSFLLLLLLLLPQ